MIPHALPVGEMVQSLDGLDGVLNSVTTTNFLEPNQITSIAVDAWSVGGGSSAQLNIPPGIETKLFQAGLFPYLAYLYFLGKSETGVPKASLFGARFLLLFVIATIPAGIAAKTQYGDILANVDLLHGWSESLLSVSNFFFCIGFANAVSSTSNSGDNTQMDSSDVSNTPITDGTSSTLPPFAAFAVLAVSVGLGSYGIGQLLHYGNLLQETFPSVVEPSNALSTQTWAVHVSSVTEWALAMVCVKNYGTQTKNKYWAYLPIGMVPFLASGLAACTFHLFRNDPSINALVPLQALLTFTGNFGCAVSAGLVYKAAVASNGDSRGFHAEANGLIGVEGDGTGEASSTSVSASSNSVSQASPKSTSSIVLDALSGKLPTDESELKRLTKLLDDLDPIANFAAYTIAASTLATVAPLAFGDFFETPSYPKALSLIVLPTVAWSAYVFSGSDSIKDERNSENSGITQDLSQKTNPELSSEESAEEEDSESEPSGFQKVKKFGSAGVVSYVFVELVFWAIALPAAVTWYRVADGTWLDISHAEDKAKLLGASAVFINGVRALVPFRLAAALALAPVVEKNFFEEKEGEGEE